MFSCCMQPDVSALPVEVEQQPTSVGETPDGDVQQASSVQDLGLQAQEPVKEADLALSDGALTEPVKEAAPEEVKAEAKIDVERNTAIVFHFAPSKENGKENVEPGFQIEFDCDGDKKTIVFRKRAFGLRFVVGQMPMKVAEVVPESQADKMGVQKGWFLETLGGQPTKGLEFSAALNMIKTAAEALPQE